MALKKTEIKKLNSLIKKLIKCGEIRHEWCHLSLKAVYDAAQWVNLDADFILKIPDYKQYSVHVPNFFQTHNLKGY